MTTSIFEKMLYGLKVANDNIVILNEKMDNLIKTLSYEETEPNDAIGSTIDGINN